MSTITFDRRVQSNSNLTVLELGVVSIAGKTAHELLVREVLAGQLQVLDSSTVSSIEEAATLLRQVNIYIINSKALTVEYTTERVVGTVNGLHSNTHHVDVGSKLSLNSVIAETSNRTEECKMLGSAEQEVTLFVARSNNTLKKRIIHFSSSKSLFCAVRTHQICIKHCRRNLIHIICLVFTEEPFASLNPFASLQILLNQRKVCTFEVSKVVTCSTKLNVSLLTLVNLLEDIREASNNIFGRQTRTAFSKCCQLSSQFLGEVRSCFISHLVIHVIHNGLSTQGHVVNNHANAFVGSFSVLAKILQANSRPTGPVATILRAGVLNTNSKHTVLSNLCKCVNLVTVVVGSSCHTSRTMNSITKESRTKAFGCCLIGRFIVVIDFEVKSTIAMQVTVNLIESIVGSNIILNNSWEVVECAVCIDTCSIVCAVTVVAGTEGCMSTYKVITGLQAFDCLIHVTCYVPSLNTNNLIDCRIFALEGACACCKAISPLFVCTFREVAIENHTANISARSIVFGNSLSEPFCYAVSLLLNLCGCCGVHIYNIVVCTERILFCGFVSLCEIVFESLTDFTAEAVV